MKLWNSVRQKGLTIIPVEVYLRNGKAKIDIAVARGKKLYDKRRDIAERDMKRDLERSKKI
jgi:SsrA-binding protein